VGVIRVGAATEVEMKERKDRVDDALQATKAAMEEGILAGGGSTLVHCIKEVAALVETLESDEEIMGAKIIMKALEVPLKRIAENAGQEGSIVVENVKNMEDFHGFDALNYKYGNMIEMGIIDPTKVTRLAIELSSSIASLLLTTEAIISEDKDAAEAASPAGMPAGGMPPMGGMGY
jgi:chaperonin GroEL